jgi:ribosomal protein S18 acetylase RimI-like enzyme
MAPTNPAFVTESKLKEYLTEPVVLYGMFYDGILIGCVAVEKSRRDDQVYYIERLAVAPEQRHQGFGDQLLCYAFDRIRESGGRVASIGLMDNHEVLKQWYITKGFVQTSCRAIEHLPFDVCFMSKDLTTGN